MSGARDGDALSPEEVRRYSRHILLPEVGRRGQEALRRARVLLVGAGGLGSPAALYLAAAGVGCLGIVDDDVVDASNLQRQILFTEADVGRGKAEAAAARLRALNPGLAVETHALRLNAGNAAALIGAYDVVVDGSDNFATRYLVNDVAVMLGKPNAHGSIYRFEGQASFFPGRPGTPCYRCVFPDAPPPEAAPSCAEGGVLGVLPGMIGVVQATETLKHLLGLGSSLVGRLLLYNALGMETHAIRFGPSPDCPLCRDPAAFVAARHAVASDPAGPACEVGGAAAPVPEMGVDQLARWREEGRAFHLLDVRSAQEREICGIAGSRHVPMADVAAAAAGLADGKPVVVFCKSGGRSARATRQLLAAGLPDVRSVRGGVLAWIQHHDPGQATY